MNTRGRIPLLFALAMAAGAIWYLVARTEPALPALCIAWFCTLVLFIKIRFSDPIPLVFAAVTSLFGTTSGALSAKLATLRVQAPIVNRVIGPVMLEGWVEGIEPGKRGTRLRLLVHAVDGLVHTSTPKHIRLTHRASRDVEVGRFVRCRAVIRPVPAPVLANDYAFDRQAWHEGLHATGYVQGRCRGGTLGKPTAWTSRLDLWIATQRRGLALYVNQVAGGFAAAMTSGDRSFMSAADQDALRGAGLAHLLAISGLHMGIAGGLVYVLVWRIMALVEPLALRFTLRKPAAVTALVACMVYLVISGASVSTQRAFIMSAIFFGAIILDRAALSLQSLSIAMIITIMIAPWSVLTPGFQMSFAATGGLIAAYETWSQNRTIGVRRNRVSFWLKSLFLTSVTTSIATMPFALYHFNRIAGFGLPANLLAMPVISLVSAPLATITVIAAPLGLGDYPLWAFGESLALVIEIAHFFNGLYPSGIRTGHQMPAVSLVFLTAALVAGSFLQDTGKRVIIALACCVAGGALWGGASSASLYWSRSGDVYLVDKGGHIRRIEFMRGDGLPPLRYANARKTDACSRNETCIVELDRARILLWGSSSTVDTCRLPPDIQVVLAIQRPDCAFSQTIPVITWMDVQAKNGVHFRLKNGQFVRQKEIACINRPWRTCTRKATTMP